MFVLPGGAEPSSAVDAMNMHFRTRDDVVAPSCRSATKRYHGALSVVCRRLRAPRSRLLWNIADLRLLKSPATKRLDDRPVTKDTAPPRPRVDISAQLSRRSLCIGYVFFTRPITADAAGGKYRCNSRNANATRTSSIALS